MTHDLILDITYPINTPDDFKIDGNVKEECQTDLLSDFIRGQLGAGADNSPPIERSEYHIRICVDLDGDKFSVTSDTGNKGLRDGIVMDVIRRLAKRKQAANISHETSTHQ